MSGRYEYQSKPSNKHYPLVSVPDSIEAIRVKIFHVNHDVLWIMVL